MRALAKHSGGRFLWFRETGIIESDDIKLLQNEIEKSCQFSEQAANLVEIIKSKRRIRESVNLNQKPLPIEQADKSSGPLVVRQTLLSAARQQMFDSNNNNTDEQHWRPTNTYNNKNLIPEWPDERIHSDTPSSRRKKYLKIAIFEDKKFLFIYFRHSSLKQESFYLNGQNNNKFSIIKNDSINTSTSGNKSIGKYASGNLVLIPTNDENETSQVIQRRFRIP